MKIQKIQFLSYLFCLILLTSCGKDSLGTMNLSNVSGKDWYKCTVYFSDSSDGDLVDSKDIGNVLNGNSCKVEIKGAYYHIYAKDALGNMVMSKRQLSSSSSTVYKDNLY